MIMKNIIILQKKANQNYIYLNSVTSKDNCFQNALNDSLDYQTIKTHPERISKLKPYINQYNWKDIKFSSDKEDWKKF